MYKNLLINVLFLSALAANLWAAPQLRLAQTALTPVAIAPGSNGPVQSVDAQNAGDGTLTLQLSSSVSWLAATLGAQHTCADGINTCTPIRIALNTSSLAKGIYTGIVTVNAPNAIDAPQTIVVTVQIGGAVPDSLTFYLPPGGTTSTTFVTAGQANVSSATQGSSGWLSVAQTGAGSFQFNTPYKVSVDATSLAAADYTGTLTVSGSSFTPDNKNIPVTLHVTTQPIAQYAGNTVLFRVVQGGSAQTQTASIANSGQGTLSVSGVTASTATGGSFLTAQPATSGTAVTVKADPAGLAPGTYTGTLAVATNAANSPLNIPVELDVLANSGPRVPVGGVVNNATFGAGESLAQGDIVAVFGDLLSTGDPAAASKLPLGTTLNNVMVLVNSQPAPVYFVGPGQINFQIPFEAATGPGTVQVINNGQNGNTVSIVIARAAPRILQFPLSGVEYGVIVNQDGSFPVPTTPGLSSHPAKSGDVLTMYAFGLGPTSPAVASGAGAPSAEPFARVTNNPQVCFGTTTPFNPGVCVTPGFAGLAPGFVGLYQINVGVPSGFSATDALPVRLVTDDGDSNTVNIAVQ